MSLPVAQCGNCLYRKPLEGTDDGECRRQPPPFLGRGSQDMTRVFPIIHIDDWCGHFRHREAGRAYEGERLGFKQWRFPTED